MKVLSAIVKVAVALAAVAGAIYVIATYGDQIVAWAKKTLSSLSKCPCCKCGEPADEEEPAAEDAPAAVTEDFRIAVRKQLAALNKKCGYNRAAELINEQYLQSTMVRLRRIA